MFLSIYSLSIILVVVEVILFLSIKNKSQKYIGIIISIIINLLFVNYPVGTRLIINLPIFIIGAIFLIKQRDLEKKEKRFNTNYESSLGLRIICLLIPLVGLIIYAVNILQNPKIAKECGKFSLIGFSIALLLSLITTFIILYG